LSEYFPDGHWIISTGPTGHLPFAHRLEHVSILQSVVFQNIDGQYEPAGHAVQVDAELAPVMDDTHPGLHKEGNSDPGIQNAPAGHSLQSD
jgi:hypothetical protein